MQKKCVMCDILLDVPCSNPICEGHYNESVGDLCVYCAVNAREDVLLFHNPAPYLVSSLNDCEPGWDNI
jgi:hypothetical protein